MLCTICDVVELTPEGWCPVCDRDHIDCRRDDDQDDPQEEPDWDDEATVWKT